MKAKMGKSIGIKLFVGGIDPTTTKEQLQAYFEHFTPVAHCKVETGKKLGLSKGFGYVTVPSVKTMRWLLSFPHYIGDRKIDVEIATKKCKKKKPHVKSNIEDDTHNISSTFGQTMTNSGWVNKKLRTCNVTSNSTNPYSSGQYFNGQNFNGDTSNTISNGVSPSTPAKFYKFFDSIQRPRTPLAWDQGEEQDDSSLEIPILSKNSFLVSKFENDFCQIESRYSPSEQVKHSKYEFISVKLPEAAANYRFNVKVQASN